MSLPSSHDENSAPAFYATELGGMAAEMIRRRLAVLWPDLTGQRVLGIGYPAPFLPLWQGHAYACLNATSAQHAPRPAGTCAVEATRCRSPIWCSTVSW